MQSGCGILGNLYDILSFCALILSVIFACLVPSGRGSYVWVVVIPACFVAALSQDRSTDLLVSFVALGYSLSSLVRSMRSSGEQW